MFPGVPDKASVARSVNTHGTRKGARSHFIHSGPPKASLRFVLLGNAYHTKPYNPNIIITMQPVSEPCSQSEDLVSR